MIASEKLHQNICSFCSAQNIIFHIYISIYYISIIYILYIQQRERLTDNMSNNNNNEVGKRATKKKLLARGVFAGLQETIRVRLGD